MNWGRRNFEMAGKYGRWGEILGGLDREIFSWAKRKLLKWARMEVLSKIIDLEIINKCRLHAVKLVITFYFSGTFKSLKYYIYIYTSV